MKTIAVYVWNASEMKLEVKEYAVPANVIDSSVFETNVQELNMYFTSNRLEDKCDKASKSYGDAVEKDDTEKIIKAEKAMNDAKKALDAFRDEVKEQELKIPGSNAYDYEVNAFVSAFIGAYNLECSSTIKAYIDAVKNYRAVYIDTVDWDNDRKAHVQKLRGYLDSYIKASFPADGNYKPYDLTLKARHFESFSSKIYGATKKGTGKTKIGTRVITVNGTQIQDKKPETAILDLYLEVFDKLGCKAPEKARKKVGFIA